MTDYTKRIGSITRGETCVVEKNIYMEDGKYIRHKLIKDNPLPFYMVMDNNSDEWRKKFYFRAVCKRCHFVSFVRPKEFFLWRPKETG